MKKPVVMKDKAKKLGSVFRAGRAFADGLFYRCKVLAQDADSDSNVKFRTTKNGQVIAIKEGEVVGGAGTNVGPDNLPTFSSFIASDLAQGKGFSAQVRLYAAHYLKPVIEALRFPRGMPNDCEKIVMGDKQIRELASHMNDDKALVLPFIAEVYRTGTYRQAPDLKHKETVEAVVYTTGRVRIPGGKTFTVELVSKKLRKTSLCEGYIQYGISKADPISEDGALRCGYEFAGFMIKQ